MSGFHCLLANELFLRLADNFSLLFPPRFDYSYLPSSSSIGFYSPYRYSKFQSFFFNSSFAFLSPFLLFVCTLKYFFFYRWKMSTFRAFREELSFRHFPSFSLHYFPLCICREGEKRLFKTKWYTLLKSCCVII